MDDLTALSQTAWEIPWLRAAAIVLASIVLAKVVDVAICQILLRLSSRTRTELDDQLIRLLHRPIFASVLLIGLHAAMKTLGPGESVASLSTALIKTLAIAFWTSAGFRLVSTALTGLSRLADRVSWLDTRSLPLFDNLSKIGLFPDRDRGSGS